MEHGRNLARLPDVIRDKIGFKTPKAPPERVVATPRGSPMKLDRRRFFVPRASRWPAMARGAGRLGTAATADRRAAWKNDDDRASSDFPLGVATTRSRRFWAS